jgi:hypothetical protein
MNLSMKVRSGCYLTVINNVLALEMLMPTRYDSPHIYCILGLFQEKIPGGWGVGTMSIIWGTTTRILIIFGVPPHKYKYLK